MCYCTAGAVEILECAIEHVDFVVCLFVRWLFGHFSHLCAMHCGTSHQLGILLGSSTSLPHALQTKNKQCVANWRKAKHGSGQCIRSCAEANGALADKTPSCNPCKKKVLQTGARLILHSLMCQGECCSGRGDPSVHALQRKRMCSKLA